MRADHLGPIDIHKGRTERAMLNEGIDSKKLFG